MRLAIHDEPLPPGCPVVYLPGIDGTGRLLHRQQHLLESHPTHCASYPQDGRHGYADLVAIGIGLLERSGPGIVLAESFGGAVALLLALERPDLVRRLILVNTFAYYPRRLIIDVLALLGRWLPDRPAHPATRPIRARFFFPPGTPPQLQTEWWERTAEVPMRAFGRRFRLLRAIDLRTRLPEIEIPTIVFTSPNDWVVPAAAGKLLARRLPHATHLAIPAGHAAMIDPRVDVAAWIETHWVSEWSQPR